MIAQYLNTQIFSCLKLRILNTCTFCVCVALLSASANSANTLFRYTNDRGGKVIADSIPPKYAAKGYEIISSNGQVIKTIPPEPSEEEKEAIQKAKAEQRRLEKWDKELLSRYSSVNDIEATKQRRVKGIENSIFSLRLTLKNISETIKFYQAEAATNERQGDDIAEDTLTAIERLQKDRNFIEQEIEKKEKDRESIDDLYDKDIQRFKEIKPEKNRGY